MAQSEGFEKSPAPLTGLLWQAIDPNHRFAISYRLEKRQRTPRLKNEPHWVTHLRKERQSHDYPNTTKSNPIQGRPKSPFPFPTQAAHPIMTSETVGWRTWTEGSRAVSRYRIASMAARFRIAWLENSGRTKAQGVRGLSPKARGEGRDFLVCKLWMRFFERGVGERER